MTLKRECIPGEISVPGPRRPGLWWSPGATWGEACARDRISRGTSTDDRMIYRTLHPPGSCAAPGAQKEASDLHGQQSRAALFRTLARP